MPRSRGIGCGTVALVIVVVALLVVWHFGFIDHVLYVSSGEQDRGQEARVDPAVIAERDDQLSGYYVYSQLDDADKEKYRIMLEAFQTREPCAYPQTTMDDVARIRDCILSDHPELFYVSGVQLLTTTNRGSGLVTDTAVEGQFAYSVEEVDELNQRIEEAFAACFSGMPENPDGYAKAKYFYEYLAAHTEYDHEGAAYNGVIGSALGEGQAYKASGQNIADVFTKGKAVCAGYASAFQFLLQRSGVQCAYVTGTANGGSHAWCVAQLDGDYYYIDPTWGDPQFLDEGGQGIDYDQVNYTYLCITTDDLLKTHRPDSVFALPECTSWTDNYFAREGLLFETADSLRLGFLAADAQASGKPLQVRCTNGEAYYALKDGFVASGELANYLAGDSYRYSCSDTFYTITVIP